MISKDTLEVTRFVSMVDDIHEKYMKERFSNLSFEPLTIKENPKYIKLIRGTGVFGFIDRETGDILFPNSWSSPEKKNPRGNIFSQKGGMEAISTQGGQIHPHIKYLK